MTRVTRQMEEKKEKEKEDKKEKFLHTDGTDQPKVEQEVLADLKICFLLYALRLPEGKLFL